MKITVYSAPGCLECQEVKNILEEHNLDYKSVVVGNEKQPGDITQEEFNKQHNFVFLMPYITCDDNVKVSGLSMFNKCIKHLGY